LKGYEKENPEIKHRIIPDEVEAINFALTHAKKNEFLVLLPDNIPRCIKIVNEFKEKQEAVQVDTDGTSK